MNGAQFFTKTEAEDHLRDINPIAEDVVALAGNDTERGPVWRVMATTSGKYGQMRRVMCSVPRWTPQEENL